MLAAHRGGDHRALHAEARQHLRPLGCTAPSTSPDMLLMIYSCSVWRVLENTGALEQRHVDATERVGGGWVGGVAGGRRAGRARGWRSRSGSIGAMASESQMKRMPGPVCAAPQALPCRTNVCRSVNSTAVPVYDAFCSAPVRCGKTECLPGSRLDG